MEQRDNICPREVTHRMIIAMRRHHRVVESNLEGTGIHRAQHRVLMTLSERKFASQTELANYLGVSPATIAISLKSLRKEGLVVKTAKEEDNRVNFVELTDDGRRIVEESCEFFDKLDYEMYQGFSKDEMEQLCSYCDRIYKNMECMLRKNTDNGGKQKI